MKKTLLLLAFCPFLGFGQSPDYTFYNDGANDGNGSAGVFVQKGALLHIQGKLTNANVGQVVNEGIIELKGDIENVPGSKFQTNNTQIDSTNEKTVKFVGDGTQAIIGDFVTDGSFFNLVVDKGVSGTAVELRTDVNVDGSLVFGTATTGAPTYKGNTSSGYTNNLNKGVIRTYDGTNTDHELYVTNGNVDAVQGYPALAMDRAALQSNSFVQTRGARGVGAGGFSRLVTTTGVNYVYPLGTVANGFQALRFNFVAVDGGTNKIRGMFCDGTDNISGYVGKLSTYCIGCANGYYGQPDNTGVNVVFGPDFPGETPLPACAITPTHVRQWVILEQAIKDHGYWSFAGAPTNSYSMETFPQSYTEEGQQDPSNYFETWRTLRYHADINVNPSVATADWTADLFDISSMQDLITYTRNAGCYNYTQPGVPGGIYTGFSHFGVFESKSDNALPVELIYLKADPINNQFIQVSWATSVEVNNHGFEVLRSTDGINFTNVGWVDGHNNSTITQTYSFDDHNVAPNVIYYYKLNQVDNDGHSKETYIVNAMITSGDVFAISEFIPNPAKDLSRIIVTTSAIQSIDVKMFDMLGRQLSQETYNLNVGENAIYFDTNTLSDATYTAVITAGNKVYSKKLVVAKQ